jgi:DNA-binding IclR family transcriptional regulator
MLAASVETVSSFLHEVRAGGRAASTLAVFLAISAFVERDTGMLKCSQRQLAGAAGVNIGDAHRALDRLVELGVLIRGEKGKYRVHPSVMWRGLLDKRGQAEETAPRLTLVEGGKTG